MGELKQCPDCGYMMSPEQFFFNHPREECDRYRQQNIGPDEPETIEIMAVTLPVMAVERYIDCAFLDICVGSALPKDEQDQQAILEKFDTDYVEQLFLYRDIMGDARDMVAAEMMDELMGMPVEMMAIIAGE